MIVPRSRLLHWTALVLLPCSVLLATIAEAAAFASAAIGVFVLVALVDGFLARGKLDKFKIEMPDVVRLSKDRAAQLEIRIRNDSGKSSEIRLGLPFPPEIQTPQEDLLTRLPEASPLARVFWPCTPVRRGNYLLTRAYLEGLSPLGLWAIRTSTPIHSELRVYPNLLRDRKNLAALFLHRGMFGLHAQRQLGKGREFEKLREYIPGDSFDEIHWKATAKRGRPVTKIFQIERTQEVYVVIDASRLSARVVPTSPAAAAKIDHRGDHAGRSQTAVANERANGISETTVLERFINAGLILGLAAEQQGDLFGLVTFSDNVQAFIRAKNGKEHYGICRDALYTLQPQTVTPDFEELFTFLRLRLRRRALLIFLTALDDPVLAESFVQNVNLIARQHLVLVNMMRPPRARELFADSSVASIDEIYRELGGHILWHDLRELGTTLQRRGVRFSLLDHEGMSAQLVSHYLSVKQRQLL